MDRNDPCFCGSGVKYKKCCGQLFSIHNNSFVGRLIRLYSKIDQKSSDILNEAGDNIPCKKGCSSCCKATMFNVSYIEYGYIKYGLQISQQQIDIIINRVMAIKKIIEERVPEFFQMFNSSNTTMTGHEFNQYQLLQEQLLLAAGAAPCPFLENDICSIYKYRPYTCRVHGPFRNPAAPTHCKDIDACLSNYQQDLPSEFNIFNALGLTFFGKPLVVWLKEDFCDNEFVFNKDFIIRTFETSLSGAYASGEAIKKSSLD